MELNDSGSPQLAQLSPLNANQYAMRYTYSSGDRPLDGYTIKRGIGCGGFGEVYYATSDGGKEVALKLVQRHLDVELRGVTQCLNLKNSHLVTLYDVKQAANGDFWVVMEYVTGETLADVIVQNPQGLPQEELLRYLHDMCDAVGYLHEQGIVHRDLKPGNIFIENGVLKLGDYGLAKFISASRRSGQTESVGTVHYMAPELSMGRYGKEIDLYAVGIILFEMLTGRVPFEGHSPGEILMKHLTAQPDVNVLPPLFRAVVARLLAKEPEQRYETVQAMLADLDTCLAGRMPAGAAAGRGPNASLQSPPPIPPRRAISLPFWLEHVYGGLAGAEGMVRLDDDALMLQFHVKDALIGVIKTGLKEVRVPYRELVAVSLNEGWFSTKIVLRASGMQSFSEVPESNRGQVELCVSRQERDTAREFVDEAMRRVRPPQERPITLGPAFAHPQVPVYGQGSEKRLVRMTTGRVWAGVCSGIGAYLGIDPVWVRIVFVLLAIFTAFVPTLFAYLLLIFIVPLAEPGTMAVQPLRVAGEPRGEPLKVFLRFPISLFFGGGVGLLTGGILHGVGGIWADEVAVLLGVGAGLFTSGTLFYLLCCSLPGRHRFWPGLAALLIGGGAGLGVGGFAEQYSELRREAVPALAGTGAGLLVAGLAGFLMFASFRVPLRWRWMFVVLFLGGGAGLLTGSVGMTVVGHDELSALVGVGTGLLTVATLITLLTLGRLSGRLKLAGANLGAKGAAGISGDMNRTQSWYAHPIPPWGWLRSHPGTLGACVLLFVVAATTVGASTVFWLHPERRHHLAFMLPVSESVSAPVVVDAELYRLTGTRGEVSALAFSPDGKLLAFSSNNGVVELWDAAGHKKVKELKGHDHQVHSISFSRDGSRVAASAQCRDVRVWDVASGEEVCKSMEHPGPVNAVALSPDGSQMATGSSDDVVRLLDAKTGKEIRQFFGCKDEVLAVAFSDDGSRVAAVSQHDGIARMWDVSSSRQLRIFGTTTEFNRAFLAISPNGSLLALANRSGNVLLWELDHDRPARRLSANQTMTNSFAFSPDGNLFAIGSLLDIQLWDIRSGRLVCKFSSGPTHLDQYRNVAFCPDGRILACGGNDGTVRLWEIPEAVRRSPPVVDDDATDEMTIEASEEDK